MSTDIDEAKRALTLVRQLAIPDTASAYTFDRFSGLNLPDLNLAKDDKNQTVLSGLTAISFFIGPNNSGKSRLLRFLHRAMWTRIPDSNAIRQFEQHQQQLLNELKTSQVPDNGNWRETAKKIGSACLFKDGSSMLDTIVSIRDRLNGSFRGNQFPEPIRSLFSATQTTLNDLAQEMNSRNVNAASNQPLPLRLYIPALRTLRTLAMPSVMTAVPYSGNQEITVPPLRHSILTSYFPSGNDRPQPAAVDFSFGVRFDVFTGEEFYESLIDHLLGTLAERDRVRKYQEFLQNQFFDGDTVELIPDRKAKCLKIQIGNEKEQYIHNLGDGLQQLILLTFPFFMLAENQPLCILVEEPELFLHPGQQRSLLDAWMSLSGRARQVFATTHSNHFLDRTADTELVSVYRVEKRLPEGPKRDTEPKFVVSRWSHDDLSLLSALGVHNSSVLLTNATIWVEGITDRLYLRRFMDVMQANLADRERVREDVHYSFVEYGGAVVTHWSFLDDSSGLSPKERINVERLCATLFLVADNWGKKAKMRARRDTATKNLGRRFYELKCKEIENILAPNVLQATVKELTGIDLDISAIDSAQYQSHGLGSFLTGLFPTNSQPRRKLAENGNGKPIQDGLKLEFCRISCSKIASGDDLSVESKDLAQRLMKFVREQNPFSFSQMAENENKH